MTYIMETYDHSGFEIYHDVLACETYIDPENGEKLFHILYMLDGFLIFDTSDWHIMDSYGDDINFPYFEKRSLSVRSFIKDNHFLATGLFSFDFYLYSQIEDVDTSDISEPATYTLTFLIKSGLNYFTKKYEFHCSLETAKSLSSGFVAIHLSDIERGKFGSYAHLYNKDYVCISELHRVGSLTYDWIDNPTL